MEGGKDVYKVSEFFLYFNKICTSCDFVKDFLVNRSIDLI